MQLFFIGIELLITKPLD